MFQWLIEVTINPDVNASKAWREHGPQHDDRLAAKAWLRRCELDDSMPQLTAGSRLRLSERPLLTRTIVVIEGLDDDDEGTSEADKPRRTRKSKAADVGVTPEQHAEIRAVANGPRLVPAPAVVEPEPEPPAEPDATPSPDDLPEGITEDDVADRPLRVVSKPSVAEAIAAPTPPSGPRAELNGLFVELFDGQAWFFQKYHVEGTAQRAFKGMQAAIDEGASTDQLNGKYAVFMKPGRAPAE